MLLLGAISVNNAFPQNDKRWGRPVSSDFSVIANEDTIRFFTGEFLETFAEKKGSLKWDSVYEKDINGNKVEKSFVYKDRREITSADESWLHLDTAYFYSRRKINPASVDSLFIKVSFDKSLGSLLVINQSRNQILDKISITSGALICYPVSLFGLDSLAQGQTTVLRFSIQNRLSSVLPLENVPVIIDEPIIMVDDNGFFRNLWSWALNNWKWLVMGLLTILCILEYFFFFLRKNRKYEEESEDIVHPLVVSTPIGDTAENKEIARRDEEIRQLRHKVQMLSQNQSEKKVDDSENQKKKIDELSNQLKEQNKTISLLESAQKESKKQIETKEELIRKKEETIAAIKKESEEALSKEKTKAKEHETKLQEDHQKQLEAKDKNLAEKNEEIKKVKEECNLRIEEEKKLSKNREDKLIGEKNEINSLLESTKATLTETQTMLTHTEEDLQHRKEDIVRLKHEQEIYTNRVVFVNYAKEYAAVIQKLLVLGDEIHNSASELLNHDLSDPYYLYKAMAKYAKAIDTIDMTQFHTDVSMVSKHGLVFSDTSLAAIQQDGNANLDESMHQYFFSRYLEKYIDPLVVFNESIIGLPRLIEGLAAEKVQVFKSYRDKILSIAEELGLTIKTVHLFEPAGNNVDLNVRLVNAGDFPSDAILEIGNCYVYPTGADRPKHKINVIVQE